MNGVFTYKIGENLYINLTNRCTNRCAFCVRDQSATYEGYPLWLKKEPTVQEIIAQIDEPKNYNEIVFCGYGEPTYRLDDMLEICAYVHQKSGKTRLNTNGHGSVINGFDIAPKLKGNLDAINISLNAPDEARYYKLCVPQIENAYGALLQFAKSCKQNGLNAWFSVVDCIGKAQVEACKKLAEEAGLPLRVREMINAK